MPNEMLTPPRPKAPPLNALRAFESAARLGGFKAAAVELAVTPGAVAQHIKTLEAWAGASLFERMSQGVRLTTLGKAVAEDFSVAFDQLGAAIIKMHSDASPRQVRIAVLPSIAQLWLSQRLPRIRAIAPEARISITALDSPPNLLREPYDLSIFFASKEVSGYGVEVCKDVIFPVCSPALASRLKQPADLAAEQFLHDARWSGHWQHWLDRAAPGLGIDPTGPTFSLYSLALQEAQNGAGVLIGHEPLVRASLDDGSLIAPFEQAVELPRKLVIATPYPLRSGSLLEKIVHLLSASD
ncbi:MAG: LysR substrate-binding domain-containing protein [Gammaproteobacteria bacterium]|nr:LysR substrate-binding domain-containing protein [Gammaproteobacteria bacterium]